ncbi:MAG: MmgE/PrpD family protein [Chloroflexi bacterium]|nr:MmgE/PrpD family protein [Chloroflexota bacterium]
MTERRDGLTQRFVEYALGLGYEDIPPQVIERAKHLFLDFLGVAFGGRDSESTGPVMKAVRELAAGAKGSATVVGGRRSFPAQYAALLNGILAHSMDFDDTHRDSIMHPGTPLFSTLLALAEGSHATGRDFLASAVAGYDVLGKLGRAHGEGVHKRGFHPTATTGIFGAVAGGARLLRLDEEKLRNALGLALSQSAGSLQFLENGAWNKRIHVGQAAHNAVVSLTFARHGAVGASEPLEGRFGYFHLFSEEPLDLEKAVRGLGSEFEVMNTAIKPYPCCRYNHGVIDALTALAREHGLRPDDVARVDVGLNRVGLSLVAEPEKPKQHPKTVVDGQFSVYFAAAVALLERNYTWQSYSRLEDPAVVSLMERVHAAAKPEIGPLGASVRVTTRQGGSLSAKVALAKGEPETPLTWEELLAKFRPLARSALSERQAEALIQQVASLEKVEDMTSLTALLRPA